MALAQVSQTPETGLLAEPFWSMPSDQLLGALGSSPMGLTSEDAQARMVAGGPNLLRPKKATDTLALLFGQFKSPIILVLLLAAILSMFLHDTADALIILGIVLASGVLGFWQERGAANSVERLLALVQTKTHVLREGTDREVPVEGVVRGDVVSLSAGAGVPGDCLILESKDLFVDEAALTGETYPVEKVTGCLAADTPLGQLTNALFMGTHVVSGTAKAVVVRTGRTTEFGKISERLRLRPPETEFERGIRRFGYLLMEITLMLVIAIFAINVLFARPGVEAFLFSLALAVGLTPQLLPAIISINLAHGAKRMAAHRVIVKRLASIENFGAMNVLCSDKTGTLTEGVVHLQSAVDVQGHESGRTLLYAYLNAHYETGFRNPIDEAVRGHRTFDVSQYKKLDEVPYDFNRKRLSILVEKEGSTLLVTKGALPNVLAVCSSVEASDGSVVPIAEVLDGIQRRYEELGGKGYRVLGVAYKEVGSISTLTKAHEADMVLLGLLVLFDPPKREAASTIETLRALGVTLKIITGDNQRVDATLGRQMGLPSAQLLTGKVLRDMSDEALVRRAKDVDVFAEVEPNQKERIILALRKAGNVVGYIGDGINDASALHAADVGISVDSAVDVARDAADIVLLEKGLGVLKGSRRADGPSPTR